MMQYFYRDDEERSNCEKFQIVGNSYPKIRLFQPAPIQAPWHVQALIDDGSDEPIELNFWPHKAKGQRRPHRSEEGWIAINTIIASALQDAKDGDDFDVIE